MRRMFIASALAAALGGLPARADAQGETLKGTTSLRLDAVDTSHSKERKLTFFASFLNKYYKPLVVTDGKAWKITFGGDPVTGKLSVEKLSDSDQGVAVVVVIAADDVFSDEFFEHVRTGTTRLLNALRKEDASALVTFGSTVDATGGLSPSHNEAVSWLSERKPGGVSPRLYEAVEKGLEFFPSDFSSIGPNRAMIVVSDGGDYDSAKTAKVRDYVQTVLRSARNRNVRINVIGVAALDDSQLSNLENIAKQSNGTYRKVIAAQGIEEALRHAQEELTTSHVLTLTEAEFEGGKEVTVKLEVEHEARSYASNPVNAFLEKPESHLWTWILVGTGGLFGLALLFFVLRAIIRAIRNRAPEEHYEEGPDMTRCPQCQNEIPIEWRVCQYCEALPHMGKLIVTSVGDLNGHTFFIRDALTNIGSADGNTVVLPDKSVSKRHAGIKVQDNRFELADYGSTNGVLVNGTRITKQFLKSGDLVKIGMVELEFSLK